ncbi:SpoIIE family protein phosphatase [Rhodoferax sp.]|uniref:SpoIIE family protein phosphatase n=1 Tax=Rhodoferax sp. TaxID=50421 RepID=UPI0025F00405|nr:SpoIIE family protein phosphatase [Rhodoferax sp.]
MKQRLLTGPLDQSLISASSSWLQSLAAAFNFSPEDLYRIDMCFEELVTNVVNYSAPQFAQQPVNLHASIGAQQASFTLIDPAAPFDPFSLPPPTLAKTLADFEIGGQGVHLVREFSNAYRYQRRDNCNRVELVFELAQPTQSPPLASKMLRNTDRRSQLERPLPSAVCDGRYRRNAKDRRALGFVSWTQIFQGVPYAAVEDLLEGLTIQDIVGEIVLLKPGDANDSVRVVMQGQLRVYLDQPGSGDFIDVGIGACVGEMSVIDHRPASAYVVAEPGTQLLVIDEDTFLNEIMAIPRVARNLMSTLSGRMRRSDELTIRRMRKMLEMEQAQRELQYARSIQKSLLPSEPLFAGDPRLDCVGRMCTAREVGGDFYDIFFLDPQHVFFVIADVCGKGLPAALFMVRAIAILRAQSGFERQSADYASRLIARLNDQLYEHNDAQQFLTAYCGILDLESLTVRYINAGHNAPAIALGDGAFEFRGEPINPFVGMIEGLRYRAGELQLKPGSVLFLYTDGVTEAEDTGGGMLGDDRLLARLNAAPSRSARELVDAVFDDVADFAAGAQQSDDITVLAIRCPAV